MDILHCKKPEAHERVKAMLKSGTIMIAWRKLSRRSILLSRATNTNLHFFKDRIPYAKAIIQTFFAAQREKSKILIVQLPQGPLLLEAIILRRLLGCKVVADVHTGFLLSEDWKGRLLNAPFVGLLDKVDLILAHNKIQLNLIPEKLWSKTRVVYDPWPFIQNSRATKANSKYIVFPASFATDEPIKEVIQAIEASDVHLKMYITGNYKRQRDLTKLASNRIIFTGYLADEDFNRLLAGATAIIAGTKREYTTLMSAWEAVAYNKPLALTATSTLKSIFKDYAIFYYWKSSQSIVKAIEKTVESKPNIDAHEEMKKLVMTSVKILRESLLRLMNSQSIRYSFKHKKSY